jgi:hypothetical protein
MRPRKHHEMARPAGKIVFPSAGYGMLPTLVISEEVSEPKDRPIVDVKAAEPQRAPCSG